MMVELEIKNGRLIRNEIIDTEGANLHHTSFVLKDKKWVSVESIIEFIETYDDLELLYETLKSNK